ncbi:MAG TPA: glycosyltransferase [Gallionella sp.]|nr:glycosyltransferase [Gallionella sp.]
MLSILVRCRRMSQPRFSIFLSVVIVVRNQASGLREILTQMLANAARVASDYEIIVVDNASTDESVAVLKQLTAVDGLPNMQVFALAKEVDEDTAAWSGVENALGDFVVSLNPAMDDTTFLAVMLEQAVMGADVVYARNQNKSAHSMGYLACSSLFNGLYKLLGGNLDSEATRFRVLSKRVINFILQHPMPVMAYRYLPATVGFARVNLDYNHAPQSRQIKRLSDGVDRAMRLLVSTTRAPMRLVTALSFIGATSNAIYSLYVIAIALFKTDVAPGWVTVSLQQSGMFFLISLVLMVLGEYILQMTSLSNEGPLYFIAQEFTSATMTRLEKLNIEAVHGALPLNVVAMQHR